MDHNNFERVFHENYQMVITEAFKVVNDQDEAKDIASQSFLLLFQYQDISNLTPQAIKSFLKRNARKVAYDLIRKNKSKDKYMRRHNLETFDHLPFIEPEVNYNLVDNLNKLPPRSKIIIELTLAGLTAKEIANKMSLPLSSVASLKSNAKKQLRYLLNNNQYLDISPPKQPESKEQIIKIKDEVNEEFIKHYTKNPQKLYNVSPRQYEIFVAELLKDMGYEVWLNNHTRDGGRDIIAVLKTPSNDSIVTIVECKKHSLENPVPIEIVERFMYTIREKDKANAGWIVTTSTFSREAQKCQHNYKLLLSLKDNKELATLCSNYGKWKRTSENSGLWLPDNPLG